MIPCQNQERGCTGVFPKSYGMRIHLRTCIHKQTRKAGRLSSLTEVLSRKSGDRTHKLKCDAKAFEIVRNFLYEMPSQVITTAEISAFLQPEISSSSTVKDNEPVISRKLMLILARLCRRTGKSDIDAIISTLSDPEFSLEEFKRTCQSSVDCLEEDRRFAEAHLPNLGYRLVTILDPDSEIRCDIHLRSVIKLLQKQISDSSSDSSIFNPPSSAPNSGSYSHPMLAELGTKCEPIVRNEIMQSRNKSEMWRTAYKSGEQSFVGMVQLYSDKTRTSLKKSAFQFYPLHATLLNFSEELRRKCIQNGSSNIAFLPVNYYRIVAGERVVQRLERLQQLKMLHLSISFILSDLKRTAYEGFTCSDKKGVRRICHPCLASYSCDLPESKDLTSVKNGNTSTRNCHRCLALTENFNKYTSAPHRNGNHVNGMLGRVEELRRTGRRNEAESILDKYSLVEQRPFFLDFPFLNIDPCLDYHTMFQYESLHNFHLGTSKDLKRSLSERLRSTTLISSSLPTKSGKNRVTTFKMIRTTVLSGINKMLAHIQASTPARGLHVDFSVSSKGETWNGIYCDDGKLMGMLESKDYRSLDMVSPFIGMFADRCCDEVSSAKTTYLFVSYVDVMQKSLSYNSNPVTWNDEKLQELEGMIMSFKDRAVSLYAEHHASKLRTEKFHQLDHIVQDIRKYGGLRYGDAGLYESAHTDVKSAYRTGSKRKNSAMRETMTAFVKDKNKNLFIPNAKQFSPKMAAISRTRRSFENYDCGVTVATGNVFSLNELELGRKVMRRVRLAEEKGNNQMADKLKTVMNGMRKEIKELLLDIGETGCRIAIKELSNAIPLPDGTYGSLNLTAKVTRVASAHIPGIKAPTACNYSEEGDEIHVDICSDRIHQRLVSIRGYYGSPYLRQDSVIVNAPCVPESPKTNLWVAKVLGIFRIPISQLSSTHSSEKWEQVMEVAFVQFYDIVPLEDEIDVALQCVKLKWAKGEEGDEPPEVGSRGRKWYSLIPVSSIRGVVHVIRGDYGIKGRGAVTEMDSVPWQDQHFYVNRFYFDQVSKEYEYVLK